MHRTTANASTSTISGRASAATPTAVDAGRLPVKNSPSIRV